VSFHATVGTAELPRTLRNYDVGLALEVSTIPSRNLTITNKFFHYLEAGLAVVASNTIGHREGLELAPGAGYEFEEGRPESLAAALNLLTTSPERLRECRQRAATAFRQYLAHDHQTHLYAERATSALR
jgi:glycosyltransferase involved in cell wall biosynthesis